MSPGTKIGPYEIQGMLGTGGMGEVYRARDTRLNRAIAIKVCFAQFSARFEREARAASALNHPNICAVYDVGEINGRPFLVMELLQGKTLSVYIGGAPLEIRTNIALSTQIAAALAEAHAKGVVHRDVKPANIFVTDRGEAKVLDFGLAGQIERSDPNATTLPTQEMLTEPGAVMGTFGYMSPEQARGQLVDARTDVFSFGAVLYEMATGRPPFRGATLAVVFDALLNREPVPPGELNPELPSGLQQIIAKALKKDRRERYQSTAALLADLEAIEWTTEGLRPETPRPQARFVDSIAVLPFENADADPEMEYLSDGIAETLLNTLSKLGGIRVVPRTTMFRYKGRAIDPLEVGRQLGVRLVLTGRVAVREGDLTVAAELIDTASESQLWGEKYSRKIEDLFAVHEKIAHIISTKLRILPNESERELLARRPTESREAFQYFLKAMYFANQWTPDALRKAVEYSWKALEEDPSYAHPYAGLAYIYSILGMLGAMRPADVLPKAKAAAVKALERDDESAGAHASLGLVRLLYEWDWAGARREFERALEIAPNDSYARVCLGVWLNAMGEHDEAVNQMTIAVDLDPLSSLASHNLASAYYGAGQEDRAIEQHRRTLNLNPAFAASYGQLAMLHARRGEYQKAFELAEKYLALSGRDIRSRSYLAQVYALSGRHKEALELIEEMKKDTPFHAMGGLAFFYAALGDAEQTMVFLEQSYKEREVYLAFLPILPAFRYLHADPRFIDLLRRIGLAGHRSIRQQAI